MSIHNALNGVTHILISVPTGHSEGEEDPVLFVLREPLLRATKDSVQWVGYLSTIGVYGETNGVEVDESAPVGSSVRRCQLRIKAERLWLDSGLPTHVFRIAGIYGPHRGTIARVRAGTATRIHIPGRKFNRIHVDDIVTILLASAARPNPGRIYNVCDDEPAPADKVTAYACELLNERVPPRLSWEEAEKTMSAMVKSFYAESKICANHRIKEELDVKLIYPTYREGFLAQVVEEDRLTKGESGSDVLFPIIGEASKQLVVLVNFGSLQAEAYLDLRQIGFQLSRLICQPVVPCSFHFSNRIDSGKLHDLEAKTFDMVLSDHLACRGQKASDIVILPLFFGKSCTLTESLPETIERVWAVAVPVPSVPLTIRVGTCLVDQEDANDDRIAQILMERIQAVVDLNTVSGDVSILVVDNDTPNQDVQKAREIV
uniref:NAD-dependent epimerase/dehydratase domain-containing protein n=1 Tax=Hyaloperonospora arabidopsidis (strain Emoy2) TaxID=559515 RepID=M4C6S8_HYAAE